MHFERILQNKIIDLFNSNNSSVFCSCSPDEHVGRHGEGGHGGDEGEQGEENQTHAIQDHCGKLPISLSSE